MKIAFLILTYGNVFFPDKIIKLAENYNLYIHPKYPNEVSDNFKKYIIKNIVETNWGDFSIVNATLNLLKSAFDDGNEYYFLISGDTYPLFSNETFTELFKKNNNMSIFSFIRKYNGLYKSSQWWMMVKNDVEVILRTRDKYKNFFDSIKLDGAYDEHYFLTILQKEIKNYTYNNFPVVFVRWQHFVISKHPTIFNKLTKADMIEITNNQSYFIRKCLPTFDPSLYVQRDYLVCLYIGSKTNQTILNNFDFVDGDICIITSLPTNDINKELLNKCIYVVPIIWKYYEETILSACIDMKNILTQWKEIVFVPEIFTFDKIKLDRTLSRIEKNKFMFKNNINMTNINNKKFMTISDINDNKTYVLNNSQI